MKRFNQLLGERAHNRSLEASAVSAQLGTQELFLRFDSKDVLIEASYTGSPDPWLGSLCELIDGKTLSELLHLSWGAWESAYKDDQSFWEFRQEAGDKFFFPALELLRASLDIYRGREYLYQESSPLVCRCFGTREADVVAHREAEVSPTLTTLAGASRAGLGCRSCVPQLKHILALPKTGLLAVDKNQQASADPGANPVVCRCSGVRESDIKAHLQSQANPTLETLAKVTKAGIGCRSCVPELKRWLATPAAKAPLRYYKNRPVADWLLDIDYLLSCFPKAFEWKMELASFRGKQVVISFDKDVSQREEEATGKELQDFLGAAGDADLAFFLRRARHLSKARG